MNVFALDLNPERAAAAHDDARVRSQCGEAAQVLSDALARLGVAHPDLERFARLDATHPDLRRVYNKNGRFAKWAATSRANFDWILALGDALCQQHRHRFDSEPPRGVEATLDAAESLRARIPTGSLTLFAMCKRTEATLNEHAVASHDADGPMLRVLAYRRMFAEHKMLPRGKPATWTRVPRPSWAPPLP